MNILKQLREEVDQKKATIIDQDIHHKQLKDNYQTELLPAMQKIFQFLKEIIEHLNFLEHTVEIKNYSTLYPQFGKLTQKNYKINSDGFVGFVDINHLMQINVSYMCIGEGEFILRIKGQFAVENEIAFLSEKNINFKWNAAQNTNNTSAIKIQKKFPIKLCFKVDYERSRIKFHIKNHSNFDTFTKTFQANEINDQLLDEVARFILRKDCDFIRLEISNEQKKIIKQNLDRHRQLQAVAQQQVQSSESELKENAISNQNFLSRFNPFSKK